VKHQSAQRSTLTSFGSQRIKSQYQEITVHACNFEILFRSSEP